MQRDLSVEPSGFGQEWDGASETESDEFLGDLDLVEQRGREDFDAGVSVESFVAEVEVDGRDDEKIFIFVGTSDIKT